MSHLIVGVDPGPEASALVIWSHEHRRVVHCAYLPNEELRMAMLRDPLMLAGRDFPIPLAIEWVKSYGMAVGQAVFETCRWVGRLEEAWLTRCAVSAKLVTNVEVRLAICGSPKASQGNIRLAIVDALGGKAQAIGTKRGPGPLYGVKNHLWSALAVAITASPENSRWLL